MFEAKLSEDGTKVIITEEDEQREMDLRSFVHKYGTGILLEKQNKPKKINLPATQLVLEYYTSIIDVADKSKELDTLMIEYHHAMPLFTRLQQEMCTTLPDEIDNEEMRKAWTEYNAQCIIYNTLFDLLNYWSELVGLESMPSNTSLRPDLDGEISKERFSRLLFERDGFRESLVGLADKYARQGVAVSIYDLTNEALEMTW